MESPILAMVGEPCTIRWYGHFGERQWEFSKSHQINKLGQLKWADHNCGQRQNPVSAFRACTEFANSHAVWLAWFVLNEIHVYGIPAG
jgi:hypothetical protein